MKKWYQLETWHRTRTGMAVFAGIELILVYIFASLAIDQGNLWQWALATILLFAALGNVVRIFVKHKK